MAKAKRTVSTIRAKLDAIKKINDNPSKSADEIIDFYKDDLPSTDGILRRKIDDFKQKAKAKKTEQKDIFGELIKTAEGFLGSDNTQHSGTKDKPRLKNKIRKYAKESAGVTLHSAKQIVLDVAKNNLFGGNGVCGSNTVITGDTITLSPKEFDLLNMLTVSPTSTTGSIMYETTEDKGLVKMNREFYNNFEGGVYTFPSTNGNYLFNSQWDSDTQKYTISGLKPDILNPKTVSDFLNEYYSSIEFGDIENVIKQSMLMTIHGDGTEPKLFNVGLNKLERLLQKLFSICGNEQKDLPLNQNPINQINEDDEDIDSYFNFDDVEGIDLDDEEARLRRVLKFRDCGDFETPVNKNHIEDFTYFSGKGKNSDENVMNTLNKVAGETYESSDQTISLENLQISITSLYITKLPKALISTIISPKMLFPIVTIYKIIKGESLNVVDLLRKLSKMFYQMIKKIFWKFIKEFWNLIKRDLLNFVKNIALTILKNKLKRYKAILLGLIALLTKLLSLKLDSCEGVFGVILQTIESALNIPIKLPIPGILLILSDKLPGYSTDKAYMNIVERLSVSGVPMDPIFGRENKLNAVIKGVIEGHSEEIDQNSFIKGSNKEIILPGIVIPPGIITIVGKQF